MGARNLVGIGLSYRPARVGNLSPAMGARNQVGIGLSYRPASLCSLATQFQTRFLESIPRPIARLEFSTQGSQPGGIDSLESILGLHKSIKIRAQLSASLNVIYVLYTDRLSRTMLIKSSASFTFTKTASLSLQLKQATLGSVSNYIITRYVKKRV